MKNRIPEFDEIVDEIAELTGADRATVAHRVWVDALNQTSNVQQAAKEFGLEPHVYSERMEEFYRDTDAFVFETLIESCRNGKRAVLADTEARIRHYLQTRNIARAEVLMFGDGTGSDTHYFHEALGDSIRLSSFDVPGSKTFEFAAKRFAKHNIPVEVITDFGRIPEGKFDIIVSFEVLEHLSDPQQAMHDMARFVKPNGIVLITESFEAVMPSYPTHLRTNLKFAKRTPLMFAEAGLIMTYFNRAIWMRPTEYTKKVPLSTKDRLRIWLHPDVRLPLLKRLVQRPVEKLRGR